MSEMVERVARILQEGDDAFSPGSPIDPWYRGAAMAAIEAMREPTEKMRDAFYSLDQQGSPTPATEGWQAMIDAALK